MDKRRPALAWQVWVLAGVKILLHVATTRLGYHRDELYFIAASKRLSASYVDFQPVTPALVRAVRFALGPSLIALRLIPTLAGAAAILLAALIARELGGNRRAQVFASFALLVVPLFVGMDSAVNTVSLETPAWMLVAFLAARLLRTQDARLWVALGAAGGLALLVKFTMLAYLLGLAAAVLATPVRRGLRTPWAWLGMLVGLAVVAPSLWWQLRLGLPALEFVRHQGTGGRVLGLNGRPGYLVSLAVLPGFVALWLMVPGALHLLRDATFRTLGITHVVALVVFLAASGKGYYAAPGIAVLLCAGAVAVVEGRGSPPRPLTVALVVSLLIPLPLLLPVIPTSVLRESRDLAQATELGERIGWEELAATVAGVADSLEPGERRRAIVLGRNYAQSAAVELYASRYRLPTAVSGHNSAYLWWPKLPRDHVAIVLGFDRESLLSLHEDVRRAGVVRNAEGVRNYEWGRPIWIAREPRVPDDVLRDRVKLFTA